MPRRSVTTLDHPARPLRRRAAALRLLLLAVTAAGCASPAERMTQSLAQYDRGEYESAARTATQVMKTTHGRTREEAAYVAGLSAYRLGRLDEAEALLTEAAEGSDPPTAAQAKASLALVRLDQDRPADAAVLLREAMPDLPEGEREQAARHAGAALDGAEPAAGRDRHTPRARSSPGDSGVFSLQVGAFRERRRAERAASDARRIVERAGLGPVSVAPYAGSRGRRLYVVRFGSFASRSAAAEARQRVGRPEYIVVAAAPEAR